MARGKTREIKPKRTNVTSLLVDGKKAFSFGQFFLEGPDKVSLSTKVTADPKLSRKKGTFFSR